MYEKGLRRGGHFAKRYASDAGSQLIDFLKCYQKFSLETGVAIPLY